MDRSRLACSPGSSRPLVALAFGAAPGWAAGTGTSSDPFTTLADAYSAQSGRYHFDTGSGQFEADVDNAEGGGWVLVLQYVHRFNTNPPLAILGAGADLPVTSASGLGTDESAIPSRWGHAGNAAMSQFPGNIQYRWYGITGGHGRTLHFRSGIGDDYPRTGAGSFNGIQNSFTTLGGHDANLPGSTNNFYRDKGDYALTNFPFWRGGSFHWGVRGEASNGSGANGTRWEVDDSPGSTNHSTIHRVWVRSVDTGTTVIKTRDSGRGTLRDAIDFANANPGEDAVRFNIPGAGPHVVALASALPTITDAGVSIDGTTQPGVSCGNLWGGVPPALRVQVDGGGGGFDVLSTDGAATVLRGLSLTNGRYGVHFGGPSTGGVVQCSHLGLAPDGGAAGNTNLGARLDGAGTLVGGLSAGQGNVISANTWGVIAGNGATGSMVRGNFIGTDPSGTAPRPNTSQGISQSGGTATWSDITRNLISGNGASGITFDFNDTVTGAGGAPFVIAGNHIGTDRTGTTALPNGAGGIGSTTAALSNVVVGGTSPADRNVVSGNAGAGITLQGATGVAVLGNRIGTNAAGTGAIANTDDGIRIDGGTGITVGDGSAAGANVVSGNDDHGIAIAGGADATVAGNLIGTGADGTSNVGNRNIGVLVGSGSTVRIAGNVVAFSVTNDGIEVTNASSRVAIWANSIHSNAGEGIELDSDGTREGPDANDAGDGDGGVNEGLNTPALNGIRADGTTSVAYDLTLDVPAHGAGYRVDFFKNTVDETWGEGEVHLGGVEAFGPGTTTGSFTANAAVSPGDVVTATTTRLTGPMTYDITSEFALNVAAVSPASPLVVTSTADTDTLGTLRHAIGHANANPGAITFAIPGAASAVRTIVLTSPLPAIGGAGTSIDGTTQGDAACGQLTTGTPHTLRIEIDGGGGGIGQMLHVDADGVTLKGLALGNSQGKGLFSATGRSNTRIECVHAGVRADGTTAWPLATGNGISGSNQIQSNGSTILNNLFSGNADDANDIGFALTHMSGGTVAGNVFGLAADGFTPLGNGGSGLSLAHVDTVTIGGTTDTTRNVIAGNGGNGLSLAGTNTGIVVRGNLIGLARDGTTPRGNGGTGLSVSGTLSASVFDGNTVSASTGWGIAFGPGSSFATLSVTDNRIGTDATGMLPRGNGIDGLHFHLDAGTSSGLTVAGNVIAANTGIGLVLQDVTGAAVRGNFIGTGADGATPMGNSHGVFVNDSSSVIVIGGTGPGDANVIARNTNIGVIADGIAVAILGNSIHSNGQLGIDLGGNGVTANDPGDGDGGPNEGLNHPVVDHFTVDGSNAVSYGVTLDVPTSGFGYRVEFFTTNAPDATNGEGQIFLGAVDLAGPGTHAGSFAASRPVAVGRSIGATATRRTGSGFDITSEFSVNATSRTANPAVIGASKSVAVVDDGLLDGDDTVAIPGATLRYTIVIRNDGAGAADAGTTVVTDQIPSNGSFKVSDFGGLSGGGPLDVTEGSPGSGLTYSFLGLASGTDDLEFSSDGGASWTYAPADGGDGTDPGVTHIRIRPDGAFNANGGTPPTIAMRYEVVLF